MNVSRRICCNAANAFRPAAALRNTFLEPIGIRFTSKSSSEVPLEFETSQQKVSSRYQTRLEEAKKARHIRRHAQEHESLSQTPSDLEVNGNEQFLGCAGAEARQTRHDDVAMSSIGVFTEQSEDIEKALQAAQDQDVIEEMAVFRSPKLAEIAEKKLGRQTKEVLEYEGQYVRPVNRTRVDVDKLPWLESLDQSKEIPRIKRMGAELQAFANWIRPTDAEVAAREAVIDQTTGIVRKIAHHYNVEVFGSSRNGLGLASSDIDLRLYQNWDTVTEQETWMPEDPAILPPKWKTRKDNYGALYGLQHAFQNHPDYILCNIRHARYPLLHMQHKPSGIDVQIVCSNDTSKQRARIAKYLQEQPHLFDLYAVLKTLLDIRGLTDVFRGGLGSYNILIMIVMALEKAKRDAFKNRKAGRPVSKIPEDHNERLGMDISQVLGFYGQFLDTYKYAVLADPFALVTKIDPSAIKDLDPNTLGSRQLRIIDKSQPYLLCLEDPEDHTNDLGRQAYGWKHIQETLRYLYRGLKDRLSPGYTAEVLSYLVALVGAAEPSYEVRRRQAQDYGARVLKEPDLLNRERKAAMNKLYGRMNREKMKQVPKDVRFRSLRLDGGRAVEESEQQVEESVAEHAELTIPEPISADSQLVHGDNFNQTELLSRRGPEEVNSEKKAAVSA